MAEVEKGFRQRSVRIVRLEVRSLNIAAQKLYESLGYAGHAAAAPKYYSNGGDGLLMLKSLD